MGNGTMSRMMGRDYLDQYGGDGTSPRPRLPRMNLDEREDVYYNGPRLRDYNDDLDPKSWGDTMKRHVTAPYVSDKRWEEKNLPRFNRASDRVKLYTGTGPFPGETDTDRLSSASKSRRKKSSKKKREEDLLLSYYPSEPEPEPERYVTKDVGTQARDEEVQSSKRKYKKKPSAQNSSSNLKSYRSIPPDYKDDKGYVSEDSTIRVPKGGLQLGPDGNLRTKYPMVPTKRRKSIESDLYSDSSRSSTGSGYRRKADPINKEIIDEALRNYGTLGRVEALEVRGRQATSPGGEMKERPGAPGTEKPVKIPRPVAKGLVTEGSMRYPVPDYRNRKRIEMPSLTATRTQLRSMGGVQAPKDQMDTACQVPDDTFMRTTSVISELDDLESEVSEKIPTPPPEVKPTFNFAEKIKQIYEEIKPHKMATHIETQTDFVEPVLSSSSSSSSSSEEEESSPEPTPPPTPKPVMVDAGTFMEAPPPPPPVIRRYEPVVMVETAPPEPRHRDFQIQANPDDIDNKPRRPSSEEKGFQMGEPSEEKGFQIGESRIRAVDPVDQSIQTSLTPKVYNKKLQAYRSPEKLDRASQASIRIIPDLDGRESIVSINGSGSSSVKSENPYQPLSYGPPPPKHPQPKSWGTTAKVENIYSGFYRKQLDEDGESSIGSMSPRPSISDTISQGVQTTTTLDTRAASMMRKLHDLESLSGILDLEPEEYASTHGGDDFPPDVISDTLSVKSGFSLLRDPY